MELLAASLGFVFKAVIIVLFVIGGVYIVTRLISVAWHRGKEEFIRRIGHQHNKGESNGER